MQLELFGFIDEVIEEFKGNQSVYQYAQGILSTFFEGMFNERDDIVRIASRIKNADSLKEKLIRNKFYLGYDSVEDALDHVTDIVGLTIECRFITDENKIYQEIRERFSRIVNGYYYAKDNDTIGLELHMPQPQLQRNGFTIYRIDGHYRFQGKVINFELQIKSLIHAFWSEIEHEVVYKNTDMVIYDSFMRNMLSSMRDNLEVIDSQLEIVTKQMKAQRQQDRYHNVLGADGFKPMLAKMINDIVQIKSKETLGFTTDFRKSSAILAQFIYINDLINNENPDVMVIEYFKHFNLLSTMDIDFRDRISLEEVYEHPDAFCNTLGTYFQSVINIDYDWHVFFAMLFLIRPGNNVQDLTEFIQVIKNLILPVQVINPLLGNYTPLEGQLIKEDISNIVAMAMVNYGKVGMVHEDRLFALQERILDFLVMLNREYATYAEYLNKKERLLGGLGNKVASVFR